MDGFTSRRPHRPQPRPIRREVSQNSSLARSPQQPTVLPDAHSRRLLRGFAREHVVRWRWFYQRHRLGVRITAAVGALLMLGSVGLTVYEQRNANLQYNLSASSRALLGDTNPTFAEKLKIDSKTQAYLYNDDFQTTTGEVAGQTSGPRFTASFSLDPKKGTDITDPYTQTTVTFKPKYGLQQPIRQDNRLVYPLTNQRGAKVLTMKAANMKEDIVLERSMGDDPNFSYEISLPDELEARMDTDGSVGVYGPSETALTGSVSTGSDKDIELLKKARQKAAKDKLIFRIPAPFIIETSKRQSGAKAWFALEKNILTIHTSGLNKASYPLTIDPSVYVETASKLMRGNNESNIDFDVDNELIQKGKTTGARFDSWTNTLALPSARWNHGTAVAGGYIYVVGGNSGSAAVGTVYWAKFNTTTGAIEAPNPGTGACANWCTNSVYDLPAVRDGASVVAYNGYLYVFGGRDSGGSRTSTVYIAKIGANGEPSLWHPTDTNKANWVYWYSATALGAAQSFSAATAYNNRMYMLGGQTNASTGGVTTVQYADISPIGTLGTWTSTGMVALPSARHNHSAQIYNDRMYLIGGNSSGTLQAGVSYIKINSDGTMTNNSWVTANAFSTARMGWGGNFATIWGGYIYVAGGCTAINGSGYCTTIASDIQLASINADGSVTDWNTITGLTSGRMSYGFVAWRNKLYGIGGCTAHNTSTGVCTTTATLTQYGSINQDGDASTVSTSVASGTAPCAASTWYDCDLPPEGTGNGQQGRMSGGTIINNGFIYYLGGCTAVNTNSVCFTGNAGKASDNISYAAIAADGTITRIASCTGGTKQYVGSWCVDNTTVIGASVAAFGYAVFNNVMYIIGGTTGTQWQDNVWRSTFNNDGSWGSFTSQTFTNLALGNAKGYQYAFTRANPSSAGTYPGNLYVLGGCSGVTSLDDGLDCSGTMYTEVYKCNIKTDGSLEETDANDCDTANQLQIDSEPGTGGSQGLGVMAGTVYANYIYMIGGQSPNESERGSVMYAKIDDSNNIVAVSGGIWQTSANSLSPVRRRGIAFGYNGYLYALAGYNVSQGGSLNDLLYAKINVSDGSIGTFTTSAVTVSARWDLRAAVNNGYVYAIGGCSTGAPPASCTVMTGTVQTFQLYNNYSGSPASFANGTSYGNGNAGTQNRIGSSSTIYNGYIYIAGGCTSATDCTTAVTDVQYAPLNSDGSIGTWAATTAVLPAVRAWGRLVQAGGSLYYLGGQDSTSTNEQSTVYYATPSSGNISTWSTASGGIGDTSGQVAQARTKFGAAVWNNRIYVVGGLDGSAASTSTVYVSPQLNAGGNIAADSWTSATAFNVARSGNTVVAYANNLYSFGGHDGTNYLNDSQFTQINSDGSVDSWSYTTSLPSMFRQGDGFAANGFMYILGGRSADTTCNSHTYVAPISANTTIASGNNPTGVGEWYETNVKYTGSRYGAAASYNEGRVYLLGGGCGATLTYTTTDRVVSSVLQAQPQIARYSRFIDTDTDVFPTKWLMNGLDNSTGAEWYMKYRSSTAATAAWGQETNYGKVTLGTPDTYTPKDSGGTNTNYARYYYMIVTIDSQRAYGYPEDVTRGPTIADLSLFFTADPSKRMRHGKTFTGGEQQPLDTPF